MIGNRIYHYLGRCNRSPPIITENIIDTLKIKENTFVEISVDNPEYEIYGNEEKVIAIYHSYDPSNLAKAKEELTKINGKSKKLYCFTFDDETLNADDFEQWKNNYFKESIKGDVNSLIDLIHKLKIYIEQFYIYF